MLHNLQNRSTAWIVTIIAVALVIWVGGSVSLRQAQSRVYEVHVEGSENNGKGIRHDIEEIKANSANLLTVASGYMDENDNAFYEIEQTLNEMDIPGINYQAAKMLQIQVELLNQRMDTLPLDETAQNYRNRLIANIRSHYKIIESSGYNAAAASFNRELRMFPTNLLSGLAGVRPLELYE